MLRRKKKIHEGYKVVYASGGRFFSATKMWARHDSSSRIDYAGCCAGTDSVQYKQTEWTFPKENCGPLAVFKNKEDALRFKQAINERILQNGNGILRVYRCEYVKSRSRFLFRFWEKRKYTKDTITLPQGSDLASEVILCERIC